MQDITPRIEGQIHDSEELHASEESYSSHSDEIYIRDTTPLTEEEIIAILKDQDARRGTPAKMSVTDFLLQFYDIVPLGRVICNSRQATDIMNLRLEREGIEKDQKYTDYSVRQKVHIGVVNKRSMKEELERPEGTAALYPLTEWEEERVFGTPLYQHQHFFFVRDVLTTRLTKHKTAKPKKQPGKRGRPRIRPLKAKRGKRGRPRTSYAARVKELSDLLVKYEAEGNQDKVKETIQLLNDLNAEKRSQEQKKEEKTEQPKKRRGNKKEEELFAMLLRHEQTEDQEKVKQIILSLDDAEEEVFDLLLRYDKAGDKERVRQIIQDLQLLLELQEEQRKEAVEEG